MADRYVVAMTGSGTIATFDGKAPDAIAALVGCANGGNRVPAGIYEVEVGIYGREPSTGRVGVRADGSITVGQRWGLPVPVEPIDVSDLGVAVGVPDVG